MRHLHFDVLYRFLLLLHYYYFFLCFVTCSIKKNCTPHLLYYNHVVVMPNFHHPTNINILTKYKKLFFPEDYFYYMFSYELCSFAITNELGRDSGDIMVERPLKAAAALKTQRRVRRFMFIFSSILRRKRITLFPFDFGSFDNHKP